MQFEIWAYVNNKRKSNSIPSQIFCDNITSRTRTCKDIPSMLDSIISKSGVPQGSHLCVILFIIFMSGVQDVIKHSYAFMYVDDVNIYWSNNSDQDLLKLQEDLSNNHDWSTSNGLYPNVDKCKSMSFSCSDRTIKYDYSLVNSILGKVSREVILVSCRLHSHSYYRVERKRAKHRVYDYDYSENKPLGLLKLRDKLLLVLMRDILVF